MSLLDKLTARLPIGKKTDSTQYFFALNVGLSDVTACVWGISNHELDILGQSTLPYDGTDDLLEKAYNVLDKALGALEIEPQKILFGVPDSWSVDDDLKEPYSKLLKKMLKEYGLEPMAFVTVTNAMAFLLQKQEGTPTTAILLGVGDFIEATLIRGGKVSGSRAVQEAGQLFEEIEKTVGHFTEVEVLPSKILLYSTKLDVNLAKIKDDLMSFPWMQKMSFLHFPKIEVLGDNIVSEAVVLAGAIEIDPNINLKHSFLTKKSTNPLHLGSSLSDAHPGLRHSLNHPFKHSLKRYPEAIDGEGEELGFVKGDIKKHPANEVGEQQEDMEGDNLIAPNIEEEGLFAPVPRRQVDLEVAQWDATTPHQGKKVGKIFHSALKSVTRVFRFEGMLGKLIFIPIILALVAAAYLFLVKATVTVYVEPKVLEQEAEVIADPKASAVDEEKKIIPGSVIETTVSGSGKAPATGQKQIGDPAKGRVSLFNKTNSPQSFSQGTVLTSSSGLKFTLDSSVKVASQSSTVTADFVTVIKPGKSDPVGVTANTIGPDGNLPGNTELSVSGFNKDQTVAQVSDALSGGTSKNVTMVTSDDQKKLQAQVLNDLRGKAETELQGKMEGGKKVISEALLVLDGKYNFSKKVNDQASEFSLNANIRFKGTSYLDSDLKTIVSKLIKTNVQDGFELAVSSMETQADVSKVEPDGRLIFKAKFKAKLLPKFNIDDLKKKMRGKSMAEAAEGLKGLDNVIGSEIKFSPNLPNHLARLPLLDKNITVIVTPK